MSPGTLQWCAHPQLASGEALSWWLHRFAWTNAVSNHTFARALFGARAFWPRDVDRFSPTSPLLERLLDLGVSQARLEAATLRHYEGTLFPCLTTGGWLPWITPVGVYHRTQRHHGHAYCPRCLNEGRPVQIAGRVAYEVACLKHMSVLRDGCPHCDAPIAFARVSLSIRGRFPCPTCGANLASAPHQPLSVLAHAFERRCHAVFRRGFIQLGELRVPTPAFFEGARILLRGLYGRKFLNGVTDGSITRSLRWPDEPRPTVPFEYWRLTMRMRALAALEAYLTEWPGRLLADANRSRVYQCRFEVGGPIVGPSWVTQVLEALPHRAERMRHDAQAENRRKLLVRSHSGRYNKPIDGVWKRSGRTGGNADQ